MNWNKNSIKVKFNYLQKSCNYDTTQAIKKLAQIYKLSIRDITSILSCE
jgi:replication initiation and membrane attachment protein DnaB